MDYEKEFFLYCIAKDTDIVDRAKRVVDLSLEEDDSLTLILYI